MRPPAATATLSMTSGSPTIALESLLEHTGWVRSLASQLVRDPDLADDLAQETMLAALEARGAPVRSPRAWLGRVLRNLLWERLRGEQRRNRREALAARDEAEPSSAELVERVDAHRSVVNAVMALPERYRLILLRRYYLDEPPTAIAKALGMPVATVKTRLQRGLEQLRGDLDEQYGGAAERRRALLPLLPVTGAKVPVVTLAAAALLLMCGGVAVWSAAFGAGVTLSPPAADAAGAAAAVAAARAALPSDAPGAGSQREPGDVHARAEIDWGGVKMPVRALAGTAVYPDGSPAGALVLEFVPDRERGSGTSIAVTDGAGAFELEAAGTGRIRAASGRVVTLLAAVADTAAVRADLCVVVAPPRRLSGRVLDGDGNPLADAVVEALPPDDLRARFGARVSLAETARFADATGADGGFELAEVPGIDGATLLVRREGYATHREPLPLETSVEVVLRREPRDAAAIAGRVIGPDGGPAFDARVACGGTVTRTDRDGRFRLPGDLGGRLLMAAVPGLQPALLRRRGAEWPASIVLRLGGPLRTIRGRVLRADGRPAADARVCVADPTLFSYPPRGGYETASSRFADVVLTDGPSMHLRRPETLEDSVAADARGRPSRPAVTDAEGRFELAGLCDRDYLVIAGDPYSMQLSEPVSIAAGAEDVELRLPAAVHEKLSGRVVDGVGRPIARVGVALQLTVCDLRVGGRSAYRQIYRRGQMITGPDGEFWVYDVPARGVSLHLSGAGLVPRTIGLDDAVSPLRVEMKRTRSLWIRCLDAGAVDAIAVLDERGEPLPMSVRRGSENRNSLRLRLDNGRTEAFTLPANAATVVAYRAGEVVRRVAVPADGGELVL